MATCEGVMFKVQDNKISLNKSVKLTPKQLSQLNRLPTENDRNRYLMTLMGILKTRVHVPRIKTGGYNRLAFKPVNSILTQMSFLRDTDTDHKPSQRDLGEWVGVEIECYIPHQPGTETNDCCCEFDDDTGDLVGDECDTCCNGPGDGHWSETKAYAWLRDRLKTAGVSRVAIKYDGSLEDTEGHGVELTILFNSKHGFEPLERLCKALLDAGCYVNKKCGLHVHLDARHMTPIKVRKVGNSIGHALPVLKWLVPESRHNNRYCELDVSDLRGERYYAVNLTAFRKYKTIEIRLHSGTINAPKIIQWVKLLKLLGDAKLRAPITTFQELIDLDGMTDSLVDYCDTRITELNPKAWPLLNPVIQPPIAVPPPVTMELNNV